MGFLNLLFYYELARHQIFCLKIQALRYAVFWGKFTNLNLLEVTFNKETCVLVVCADTICFTFDNLNAH